MSTHDNAPPPPEWQPDPRPCQLLNLLPRLRMQGIEIPDNVTLGEN